jgi:hypothetical protein
MFPANTPTAVGFGNWSGGNFIFAKLFSSQNLAGFGNSNASNTPRAATISIKIQNQRARNIISKSNQ